MVAAVVVSGCTEPNPNALGAETTGGPSSGTANDDASMTDDPTMTSSPTSATSATSPTSTTDDTTQTDSSVETTQDPSDSDPTPGSLDSSGEPPTCPAGTHVCVGEVPVGWTGPVALLPSVGEDPEPECAGDWDELSTTAFTDLQASAAQCDCECATSVNSACTTVTLTRSALADSDCSPVQATWDTGTNCTAMPASSPDMQQAGNGHYWRAVAEVTSGTCAPMPTESIEPAVFSVRTTLCASGGGTSAGCEAEEQCLPVPDGDYDGRMCIWQTGDLQCPAGAWTERSLLHQDIADDRDCTACSCGDAEGECHGSLGLANAANCSGQLVANIPIDSTECTQGVSNLTSLGADVLGALTPDNPTCDPSNSTPIGDAEAVDPITVCCLP